MPGRKLRAALTASFSCPACCRLLLLLLLPLRLRLLLLLRL
jgi:hypothetical protein